MVARCFTLLSDVEELGVNHPDLRIPRIYRERFEKTTRANPTTWKLFKNHIYILKRGMPDPWGTVFKKDRKIILKNIVDDDKLDKWYVHLEKDQEFPGVVRDILNPSIERFKNYCFTSWKDFFMMGYGDVHLRIPSLFFDRVAESTPENPLTWTFFLDEDYILQENVADPWGRVTPYPRTITLRDIRNDHEAVMWYKFIENDEDFKGVEKHVDILQTMLAMLLYYARWPENQPLKSLRTVKESRIFELFTTDGILLR